MSGRKVKVVFSTHATRRCLERGIDKEDIDKVCLNPLQTIYDGDRKNYKSVGKVEDIYQQGDRFLVVIHTKEVDGVIHVISAMHTSRGGLPKFGFSDL